MKEGMEINYQLKPQLNLLLGPIVNVPFLALPMINNVYTMSNQSNIAKYILVAYCLA